MNSIKNILIWVGLSAISLSMSARSVADDLPEKLKAHVKILASDSLEGRGLGTDGLIWARNYVISAFEDMGLKKFDDSYNQDFMFRSGVVWVNASNVVGFVQGSDPVLKDEYIVIGAHLDHLGYRINEGDKTIFNGADDNASGVASMLELAAYFSENRNTIQRSIIFIAFDAEESGLHGARHFTEHSPVELDRIKAMFSIDMVGMYSTYGGFDLFGMGLIESAPRLANEIASGMNLKIKTMDRQVAQNTDTAPFAEKGISAMHVFTGLVSPYHKPEDTYDLLDYEGMAQLQYFLRELIMSLANRDTLMSLEPLNMMSVYRGKKFFSGFLLGTGPGYHRYKDEFFRANSVWNFQSGLYLQWAITSVLTLQQEILYDYNGSQIEDGVFRRHSFVLPLSLQIGSPRMSPPMARAYVSGGAYWRYNFAGNIDELALDFENDFRQQQWGYSIGIGIEVMRFSFIYTHRKGLDNLLISDQVYDIRNVSNMFSLGYRF